MDKRLLLILVLNLLYHLPAAQVAPDQATFKAHAPALFQVVFQTSKGDFIVEVNRNWSPEGADRFFQLVETRFYDRNYFFRVQKNYVVQFGICNIPEINSLWDKRPINDEPVKVPNTKGTLAYARDGMHSRTTQLFINMKDNLKLDTVNYNGLTGFSPFARIVSGFETVEKLFGEYGFEPANHQDSIMVQGNHYLSEKFPLLDSIQTIKLLLP
jgi:cyclophilin family peptidyl-prolyl cis-trans isomerase